MNGDMLQLYNNCNMSHLYDNPYISIKCMKVG